MRFLKVLGLLLIIAAVCRLSLLLVATQGSLAISARHAGQALGGALFIFGGAAITVGVSAFKARAHREDYPGLAAGFVVAVIMTVMAYAGGA